MFHTKFRSLTVFPLAIPLLVACGAVAPGPDDGPESEADVGDSTQALREATRADDDAMLEMVQIETARGSCSGVLIAADTVLTAAHCFCDDKYVGTPNCSKDARVTFRQPQPWKPARVLQGISRPEPKFNPSWTEGQWEHDVATIALNGVAPNYIQPAEVATGYLPVDTIVRFAGFGHWGKDCKGDPGPLAYDTEDIDGYEDGHDIMTFDQLVACKGDSGGGIFDADGRVRGIISMHTPWTEKATTTGSEYDWIKAGMCRSSAANYCTGQGPTCTCTARKDILWQNADGRVALWSMNGAGVTAYNNMGTVYGDWQLQGTGDFDGDGQGDVLWRHQTGQTAIWYVHNGVNAGQGYPGGADPGLTWKIQATGDFNGDGRTDILWRHTSNILSIWFEGDANHAAYPGWNNRSEPVEAWWQVKGVADFNGDRYADILWQSEGGQVSIWYMNGGTRIGEFSPGSVTADAKIQGIGDFDGNGKADILWRTGDAVLWIWFAGVWGTDAISYQNSDTPSGWEWTVQGVGDFNHDGRDDILWRHAGGDLSVWYTQGARFIGDAYLPKADTSWKLKSMLPQSGL